MISRSATGKSHTGHVTRDFFTKDSIPSLVSFRRRFRLLLPFDDGLETSTAPLVAGFLGVLVEDFSEEVLSPSLTLTHPSILFFCLPALAFALKDFNCSFVSCGSAIFV